MDGTQNERLPAEERSRTSPGDRSVILFDGHCPLCVASVRFVLRHDRSGHFRFASLDSPPARELLDGVQGSPDAAREAADGETVAVVEGTRLWVRSDAALRIASRLGWPWTIAAVLRFVPRAIRDRTYSAIASRRHALARPLEACPLPDAGTAERFL
jgi:predicted DCC family thiol-disulfide oxidoreductase YuxK